MKLGEQGGSYWEDRIDVELSPGLLQTIISAAEAKAMSAKDYSGQGIWREIKDCLQARLDDWRQRRDKKDRTSFPQ